MSNKITELFEKLEEFKIEKVIIKIPYPMPTWNKILAMHWTKRKKLNDLIYASMSRLKVIEDESTTPTVLVLKPHWTELLNLDYYRMIRPKKSERLPMKASLLEKIKKRGQK